MKIEFTTRVGEKVIRQIQIGINLVGLRLDNFTVEGWDEANKLFTDEYAQRWYKKCLLPAMRRQPKKPEFVEEPKIVNKEYYEYLGFGI